MHFPLPWGKPSNWPNLQSADQENPVYKVLVRSSTRFFLKAQLSYSKTAQRDVLYQFNSIFGHNPRTLSRDRGSGVSRLLGLDLNPILVFGASVGQCVSPT